MNKFLSDIGVALFWQKVKDHVASVVALLQPREPGKGLSTNDYTDLEHVKLASIENGANNYTLPATLPAAMIEGDMAHRFVSDYDKANYEDKYTKSEIDNLIANIVKDIDWKEAVATFADLATEYPDAEEGWAASVNDEGAIYRYNGTIWIEFLSNSVIPLVTDTVAGLMHPNDKDKLDGMSGIDYVHPTTSGFKHIPSGGTVGQVLFNQDNGTGEWRDLPSGITVEALTSVEIDDICQ